MILEIMRGCHPCSKAIPIDPVRVIMHTISPAVLISLLVLGYPIAQATNPCHVIWITHEDDNFLADIYRVITDYRSAREPPLL